MSSLSLPKHCIWGLHGPCRLVSWLKRGLFHTFAIGQFLLPVKHYVSTRSQCASVRLYPSLQLSACTSFDTDRCVFGEVIAVQSVPTTALKLEILKSEVGACPLTIANERLASTKSDSTTPKTRPDANLVVENRSILLSQYIKKICYAQSILISLLT